MKKLISYFLILALFSPVMGQEVEVKKDTVGKTTVKVDGKEVKQCCQVPKQLRGDHGDMRGRMGAGNRMDMAKRKGMAKKQKIRQAVRLVAVGSLAYYIGYHEGEKHFKPGGWMKRPGRGGK